MKARVTRIHIGKVHKAILSCSECQANFDTVDQLERHMDVEETLNNVDEKENKGFRLFY